MYAGIDIGGTNIKVAVISEQGDIIRKKRFPRPSKSPQDTVKIISEKLDEITSGLKVKGIGVACAGDIDQKKGVVRFSPNLGWKNFPLKQTLEKYQAKKVILDNDATAQAWAAYILEAKGARNLICLTLGTGIGGGIVIEGKLYRGSTGSAAEVGHITIKPQGRKCSCGNHGCLEAYAAAGFIIDEAKRNLNRSRRLKILASKNELSPKNIASLAREGDEVSRKIFEKLGRNLGIGLASLTNILNPDVFVISGGISRESKLFFSSLKEEMKKRTFRIPFKAVKILFTRHPEELGILGAAFLARDNR